MSLLGLSGHPVPRSGCRLLPHNRQCEPQALRRGPGIQRHASPDNCVHPGENLKYEHGRQCQHESHAGDIGSCGEKDARCSAGIRAESLQRQWQLLGLVILLAMTAACMASGLFGVLVPLTLQRFGADPCTASSIFLTTGTDIASMGLMLALATVLVL